MKDDDTTDGAATESGLDRRRLLKAAGASAAGLSVLPGVASAWGKEISWVAFCGCTDFCIQSRHYEEGELVGLRYYPTNCDAVYYKTGPKIYRHEVDATPGENYLTIDTSNAGSGDPAMEAHPSVSRDPCGILSNTTGTKLEKGEIESYAYDCD